MEFIAIDSEYYASSFASEIYEKADTLTTLFNRGRIVPEISKDNIREIFIGDYRMVYDIGNDNIHIIAIIHGRRDLKKYLSKHK